VNDVEGRLVRTWYGEAEPPAGLRLLEPLYRAAVRIRRAALRRGLGGPGHPGRPVVVIGNLTVGGTGKTPLVVWLVGQLAARGLAPAVVSRGYGGRAVKGPRRVAPGDDPAIVGDEPALIAALTKVPVWVCPDRLAAARAAVQAGADVVVSDDGLQHYALARDAEIVVVDGTRGFGNGHCLPAGPLREPPERMAEVDAVVCNGGPRCPDGSIRMVMEGGRAVRLSDGLVRGLDEFRTTPVHAVAAIGNPERFFALLEASGLTLIRHPLPDHAPVPAELLGQPDGAPVLMTSKDAVKCRERPGHAWEVPVEARLENDGRAILELVLGLVERHEAAGRD
jgi:tetraacyldisaccharide 4'-kinase